MKPTLDFLRALVVSPELIAVLAFSLVCQLSAVPLDSLVGVVADPESPGMKYLMGLSGGGFLASCGAALKFMFPAKSNEFLVNSPVFGAMQRRLFIFVGLWLASAVLAAALLLVPSCRVRVAVFAYAAMTLAAAVSFGTVGVAFIGLRTLMARYKQES